MVILREPLSREPRSNSSIENYTKNEISSRIGLPSVTKHAIALDGQAHTTQITGSRLLVGKLDNQHIKSSVEAVMLYVVMWVEIQLSMIEQK